MKRNLPSGEPSSPTFEVIEEGLVVHPGAKRFGRGATIEARAYGSFELDGHLYEFDRVIKIRGTKVKP